VQTLPWHADTLLQLAEVYRHREGLYGLRLLGRMHTDHDLFIFDEEYSQATDFVNRALFAYERSFIGTFNFTSGLNRLDFDRVENRPFFLAVHRQVMFVSCSSLFAPLGFNTQSIVTSNDEGAYGLLSSLHGFCIRWILPILMERCCIWIIWRSKLVWFNGCWTFGNISIQNG
jgi:hypothetical protein